MPLPFTLPTISLLTLLLQAEPAPAAPGPGPAPAAPGPTRATGPAEAAPPTPQPDTAVGLGIGLGRRLGAAARDVPPGYGLAFATTIHRHYDSLADGLLQLGAELNFSYERYAKPVTGSLATGNGQELPFDDERVLSYFDFCALQTLSLPFGRFHPFVAAGGGLGTGYFLSHEVALRPGESRALWPLARAAAGLAVDMTSDTALDLRVDYFYVFSAQGFQTQTGSRLQLFGARMSLTLGFLYRF